MKKGFLFLVFQFFTVYFLLAQTDELLLKPNGKGFYVEHKVTPKENFYSIGRLFNVHPKYLAAFNSLDMSKGLNIGQVMRIPLSDTNFSQNTDHGVPVYIKTEGKESVAQISLTNKVSPGNLRTWNDLSDNSVNSGTKLIVGFLVSGELAESNAAITIKRKEPVNNSVAVEENKKEEIKKTEQPEKTNIEEEKTQPVVKEEPKKEEPKMEETMTSGSGYFKNNFEQQVKVYPLSKKETVTSGIFKTSSGWQDAKYYALIDGVEPGTVIKVTNPSNNKSIYAKVLGEMKGIRQNKGLDLRVSEAAVSVLDISDPDKFIVQVNY